jgi:hypothetical protein
LEIGATDDDTATEQLAADLVVDASGRGSVAPKWLDGAQGTNRRRR